MKKFQHKASHKIKGPKKILPWVTRVVLLLMSFAAIAWFLGHKNRDSRPAIASQFKIIKIDQMYEDMEISKEKTAQAVQLLKDGSFQQAVDEFIEAINICPVNTSAYMLLAKAYLVAGQEQNMYYVIDRAGDSYANLNDVVAGIDDTFLDEIPLGKPKADIFLARFPEHKKMAISFMFDDGEENIYDHLKIFEKYGFRATISVIAGFVGTAPHWSSWGTWRDAANRGFEIANHSMDHRDLSNLSKHDLDMEIDLSKELIEKNTGHKVTAFVFPGGSCSNETVARALKTHEDIRTPEFLSSVYHRAVGIVYGGPFFSLNTANRFVDIGIKRRLWIVAKAHGITTNPGPWSYKPIAPSLLDAHLSYIHSKLNDIYVDTFTNVFEYMYLRRKTKIEIKDFSRNSADFALHSNIPGKKLTRPLTVVLKAPFGANVSARTASGHKLKTWSCAVDKLCVDVDSYDENIHVQ